MTLWQWRPITWCLLCLEREQNGPDADLCARCEGVVLSALHDLEEAANG